MDQEQNPRPRARELVRLLVPDWRPTPRQVLWAIRISIVLAVLIAIGYTYDITLWDWIKLLIIPAVIAGGGLWFNAQQREREQQIAKERAQDEALEAYLDQMSQLLTDEKRPLHRAQVGDSLSTVARARTLTVLTKLDGGLKGILLRFLYESGLLNKDTRVFEIRRADLSRADLSSAALSDATMPPPPLSSLDLSSLDSRRREGRYMMLDLSGINLSYANLNEANLVQIILQKADLSNAQLKDADLEEAWVHEADLSYATLNDAKLRGAILQGANLYGAYLKRADLSGAWLTEANVYGADLIDADLSGDDLSGAKLTWADLHRAKLDGATMPNGQKYEDWLKSREGDGE